MGRRGLLIGVVLLLVITAAGVAAAYFVSQGGSGTARTNATPTEPPTPIPTSIPTINVVIAVQPMVRGQKIIAGSFITAPWPYTTANPLPQTVVTDGTELLGKIVRYPIFPGEPILSSMVVDDVLDPGTDYGGDFSAQIPSGFVAISLPYDKDQGASLAIREGDHIDILVSWALVNIDQTFQSVLPNKSIEVAPPNPDGTLLGADISVVSVERPAPGSTDGLWLGRGEDGVGIPDNFYVIPQEPQRARFVTQAILQNVIVFHLGDFGELKPLTLATPTSSAPATNTVPTAEGPSTAQVPTNTPVPPATITLLVQPQDALVINYLNRLIEHYPGSVQMTMVLRSARDHGAPPAVTDSVTLQYMFERYTIALPAQLNYGPAGVDTVINPTITP